MNSRAGGLEMVAPSCLSRASCLLPPATCHRAAADPWPLPPRLFTACLAPAQWLKEWPDAASRIPTSRRTGHDRTPGSPRTNKPPPLLLPRRASTSSAWHAAHHLCRRVIPICARLRSQPAGGHWRAGPVTPRHATAPSMHGWRNAGQLTATANPPALARAAHHEMRANSAAQAPLLV